MNEQLSRPSWVNRLIDSIEKLPAPPWPVYLAVAVPLVAVFVAIQAWQGAYRSEGVLAWHIFVAVQPLYGVVAIHHLNRFAANAMRKFRPAMKGGETEFNAALYRLTSLSSRHAGIASLIGALFILIQLLAMRDAETLAVFQHVCSTSISLAVNSLYIVVA